MSKWAGKTQRRKPAVVVESVHRSRHLPPPGPDGLNPHRDRLLQRPRNRDAVQQAQGLRPDAGEDAEGAAVEGEAGGEDEADEDGLDGQDGVQGPGRVHRLPGREQGVGDRVVDLVVVGRKGAVTSEVVGSEEDRHARPVHGRDGGGEGRHEPLVAPLVHVLLRRRGVDGRRAQGEVLGQDGHVVCPGSCRCSGRSRLSRMRRSPVRCSHPSGRGRSPRKRRHLVQSRWSVCML